MAIGRRSSHARRIDFIRAVAYTRMMPLSRVVDTQL